MQKTIIALGATTLLLAACGQADTPTNEPSGGPIVSAPESPMNPAVDTSDNRDGALTPGASSFTSTQARQAIEGQGYTNVGEMTQDAQGVWSATATKDGAQSTVSVDYQGVVTAR